MKTWIRRLLTQAALLAAVWPAQAGTLNVVATTPELGALANAIGGPHVRVRTITTGREDPHFLQARPTFMVMTRDADLWIRMGMDLEVGWEPVLLDGARNPRIRVGQPGHFDGAAYIAYALEVPDATVTRAMGDVHPSGNPHYMLDPLNARSVAVELASRLGTIDPERRTAYDERLGAFLARLDRAMFGDALVDAVGGDRLWEAEQADALDDLLEETGTKEQIGGWLAIMRPWRGKPVITFHKSWEYLEHRFGFRIAAQLEPLPGVPPTPAHLAHVVALANAEAITKILKEPFYPLRPARFVADRTPARVVEINSYGTDDGPDGYFQWMDRVITAFKP